RKEAADDDERLQRERERQPGGEQLREAVVGEHRDLHPARDEEHVDEQERRNADEPELLRQRRVDEVRVQVRDQLVPARRLEGALAEPGPEPVAVRERVERLDELVASAVLPQRGLAAERARNRV